MNNKQRGQVRRQGKSSIIRKANSISKLKSRYHTERHVHAVAYSYRIELNNPFIQFAIEHATSPGLISSDGPTAFTSGYLDGIFRKFLYSQCETYRNDFFLDRKFVNNFYRKLVNYLATKGVYVDGRGKNIRMTKLISQLFHENSVKIFGLFYMMETKNDCLVFIDALKKHKVPFHDFIENIGNFNIKRDYNNLQKRRDILKFLKKVIAYDSSSLARVIPFINYQRVNSQNNKKEMLREVEFLEHKISERKKLGGGKGSSKESFMLVNNWKFQDLSINGRFTKEEIDILNIGTETGCCFKRGGIASILVEDALKHPLASILTGRHIKQKWFAYIWEIVEYDIKNKCWTISLVLDNIEANQRLDVRQMEQLVKHLATLPYHKIYCGTIRNDYSNDFNTNKTSKATPYKYPMDKITSRHTSYWGSYDDSSSLRLFNTNSLSNKYSVERMGKGDLYRCKYIERLVYTLDTPPKLVSSGNVKIEVFNESDRFTSEKDLGDDKDFLKIDLVPTPSFVIKNHNSIIGYLITEYLYWNKQEEKYEAVYDRTRKYVKEHFDMEKKCLHISDVYLVQSRKVLPYAKEMFNNLIDWYHENRSEINAISVNTNQYSEPLFNNFIKDVNIESQIINHKPFESTSVRI